MYRCRKRMQDPCSYSVFTQSHQRSSAVLLRPSQPKIKQRHNERHPPRRPQIPQPQTHLHHHHSWHTRGLGLDVNLVRRERGDEVGKVDVEDGLLGLAAAVFGQEVEFRELVPDLVLVVRDVPADDVAGEDNVGDGDFA